MTSVNENIKRLEELSQEDGTGGLLVCYETGREKPHADSSYQLYPVNPDQKGMTYQFLSLLHVGVETARISAFIPDTRMEVYRFPRMSDLPPFYRDTPVKEYITGMLLPHIKKNRLKPVVSVNLRDMVFIRSEGLSVESGGILRNGAPGNVTSCKERGECLRRRLNIPSGTRQELCYAVHAEQNAVIQAARIGVALSGATLYCTHQPCVICAKIIINAGITRVVFAEGYPDEFALSLFKEAGVQIERVKATVGDK